MSVDILSANSGLTKGPAGSELGEVQSSGKKQVVNMGRSEKTALKNGVEKGDCQGGGKSSSKKSFKDVLAQSSEGSVDKEAVKSEEKSADGAESLSASLSLSVSVDNPVQLGGEVINLCEPNIPLTIQAADEPEALIADVVVEGDTEGELLVAEQSSSVEALVVTADVAAVMPETEQISQSVTAVENSQAMPQTEDASVEPEKQASQVVEGEVLKGQVQSETVELSESTTKQVLDSKISQAGENEGEAGKKVIEFEPVSVANTAANKNQTQEKSPVTSVDSLKSQLDTPDTHESKKSEADVLNTNQGELNIESKAGLDVKNNKMDDAGKDVSEPVQKDSAIDAVLPQESVKVQSSSGGEVKGIESTKPESVSEQIQYSVKNAVSNGTNKISITLNPPELGKISIELKDQDGQISAVLQVTKSETKFEIQQNIAQITKNLEASGVQVKKIEVILNDQPEQQSGKDQQMSQNGFERQSQDSSQQEKSQQTGNWFGKQQTNSTVFDQPESYIGDKSIDMLI
jgi:flagellar hook-length control protein FliK